MSAKVSWAESVTKFTSCPTLQCCPYNPQGFSHSKRIFFVQMPVTKLTRKCFCRHDERLRRIWQPRACPSQHLSNRSTSPRRETRNADRDQSPSPRERLRTPHRRRRRQQGASSKRLADPRTRRRAAKHHRDAAFLQSSSSSLQAAGTTRCPSLIVATAMSGLSKLIFGWIRTSKGKPLH